MFARCPIAVKFFLSHHEKKEMVTYIFIFRRFIFFKIFHLEIPHSEVMRVEMSMEFVAKINRFSCQKAGGFATAPILPKAIGQTMSCMMCVTRGQCLGKNCLGDNGMFIYSFLL